MNGFILNSCIQRVYVISPSKLQHIYHSFRLASLPNHTNVKMWLTHTGSKNMGFCNKMQQKHKTTDCCKRMQWMYWYICVKAGGTFSDIYRECICFRWAKHTMRKFETPRQSRIYKPCLPSELYWCLTVSPGFLCLVSCWHFQRKPQNETVISRRPSLSGARG
jgi:hypothetical protein